MRPQALLLSLFAFHTALGSSSDDFDNYLMAEMYPELESVLFPKVPVAQVEVKQEPMDEVFVKLEPVDEEQMVEIKHEPVEIKVKIEPGENATSDESESLVQVIEPSFIIIKGEVPPFPAIAVKPEPTELFVPVGTPYDPFTCTENFTEPFYPDFAEEIQTPQDTQMVVEVEKKSVAPVSFSLPTAAPKRHAVPSSSVPLFTSSSSSSRSSSSSSSSDSERESRKRPAARSRGRSPSPKRRRFYSPDRRRRSPSPQRQRERSRHSSERYSSTEQRSRRNNSFKSCLKTTNSYRTAIYETEVIPEDQLYYTHQSYSRSRIAVYGLRACVRPEEIHEWCSKYGAIDKMIFVRESRDTNRNVAFIEYESERDAERAVNALHDRFIGGQRIGVIFCEEEYSRYARIVRAMVPEGSNIPQTRINSLFDIQNLNEEYGPTLSAFYNRALKVGFVTFASEGAAKRAVEGFKAEGLISSRRCDKDSHGSRWSNK